MNSHILDEAILNNNWKEADRLFKSGLVVQNLFCIDSLVKREDCSIMLSTLEENHIDLTQRGGILLNNATEGLQINNIAFLIERFPDNDFIFITAPLGLIANTVRKNKLTNKEIAFFGDEKFAYIEEILLLLFTKIDNEQFHNLRTSVNAIQDDDRKPLNSMNIENFLNKVFLQSHLKSNILKEHKIKL